MLYMTITQAIAHKQTRKAADARNDGNLPARSTVIDAIKKGQLPATKPGHDWMIHETDWFKWIEGFPYTRNKGFASKSN